VFNKFRIKLHKFFFRNPPKPVFKNPYGSTNQIGNGKPLPIAKARIGLSFPFLAECVKVVKEDKDDLKIRIYEKSVRPIPKPKIVQDVPVVLSDDLEAWFKAELKDEQKSESTELDAEKYYRFEELAYGSERE
jgi:hypothetical protein